MICKRHFFSVIIFFSFHFAFDFNILPYLYSLITRLNNQKWSFFFFSFSHSFSATNNDLCTKHEIIAIDLLYWRYVHIVCSKITRNQLITSVKRWFKNTIWPFHRELYSASLHRLWIEASERTSKQREKERWKNHFPSK